MLRIDVFINCVETRFSLTKRLESDYTQIRRGVAQSG
jgi:hypothetical protein